ncbi:MAG: exosortase/archaeosortase family protein [Gemmatimonadaceae bacterium]|nr:exosortase/archaeosortase family protein [Gemmatimonadaceae bacterium]
MAMPTKGGILGIRSQPRWRSLPTGPHGDCLCAAVREKPAQLLADAWWNDPNSGRGLDCCWRPLSLWLAFRAGLHQHARPQHVLGLLMLIGAVVFRYAAELAAELFVMRCSMILAIGAPVVWHAGFRQLLHWWLPFSLVILSVPIPEVILTSVALPLQFMASEIGAGLLWWSAFRQAVRQRDSRAWTGVVRRGGMQRASITHGALESRRVDGCAVSAHLAPPHGAGCAHDSRCDPD